MIASNIFGKRFAVALTLLGGIAFTSPSIGLAQIDVGACGAYSSQEEAQADLDADPDLAPVLDSDGNGIACEGFQSGGPVVVDPVSCGFFETQDDAQAALDENPDLALTLDNDGNGIACEGVFDDEDDAEEVVGETNEVTGNGGDDEGVSALPSTGSGVGTAPADPLAVVAGALALAAIALAAAQRMVAGQSSTRR